MNLTEAFKELDALTEDIFDVDEAGIKSLKDFTDINDADDSVQVIDLDADSEDELQDSYAGKVVLDCCVCHSKIFKDPADVIIQDDLANVDEECPYCATPGGFKVIGQIGDYNPESADNINTEVDEGSNSAMNEPITENINVDDPVEADREHTNLYGGDSAYCNKCGDHLKFDENGELYCPSCESDIEDLDESFDKVEIDTGDEVIEVSASSKTSDDVVQNEEVIEPISPETQEEIETDPDDEVDIDIDDFDNETFDKLGENYLKKVYKNVDSYKTTNATCNDTQLKLEGIIKFSSGNEKKTNFIFEAKDINKSGRVRFIGQNTQITENKNAFMLNGKVENKAFLAESLNYSYHIKDDTGKRQRLYGTVKNI